MADGALCCRNNTNNTEYENILEETNFKVKQTEKVAMT